MQRSCSSQQVHGVKVCIGSPLPNRCYRCIKADVLPGAYLQYDRVQQRWVLAVKTSHVELIDSFVHPAEAVGSVSQAV